VLTSSIQPDDLAKAKAYAEVKGFFSKPLNYQMLNELVQLLG
jgi:hypothetical protein